MIKLSILGSRRRPPGAARRAIPHAAGQGGHAGWRPIPPPGSDDGERHYTRRTPQTEADALTKQADRMAPAANNRTGRIGASVPSVVLRMGPRAPVSHSQPVLCD